MNKRNPTAQLVRILIQINLFPQILNQKRNKKERKMHNA